MTTDTKRINPFPGLRPFRQDEDYLFFGREEQTMELIERLNNNRLLAVVGTSGSGKSSLVRCGLLSELQGGNMLEAGTMWEVAITHPGGHPMSLLADALLEADVYDRDQHEAKERLIATLNRSHLGLVEAVRQAELPEGTNFLLVVDQFEELFRFHSAGKIQSEVASEFVATLLEACAQTEVPIYVVITMRSDFIGDCSKFEKLAEAINAGEYLIPKLTWDQYKGVIEGPIRVGQAEIAPRLLQRLLNDVRQGHDQLPCLQHALMRTWDIWSNTDRSKPLDLKQYQQAGGTSHALSLHADEVYNGLASDRQREICEGLFKALTVCESSQRGVRRPQSLQRLCEIIGVESSELEPVINAFRRHGVTFLMPSADVKLQENTVIDISHESLMRVWERLRGWVDEEAQSVSIFHRLAESASLHQQGKVGLYRNPELGVALSWRDENKPTLEWAAQYGGQYEEAIDYLNRSREAETLADEEREAARQKELKQAKQVAETESQRAAEQLQASVRLRWLVRGLGVVVAVALLATVLAVVARNQAAAARNSADAALVDTEKALADVKIEKSNAETARQKAVEARENEEDANRKLQRRLYLSDISEIGRLYSTGNFLHARKLLAKHIPKNEESKAADQRGWEWYYWWRACHRETVWGSTNSMGGIAISRNQKWMAIRSTGWLLSVYDPVSFRLITTLGENLKAQANMNRRNAVLFSHDDQFVATIDYRHPENIRVWRTEDWSELTPLKHNTDQEWIAFSSTGKLAAIDSKGVVTFWNREQSSGQTPLFEREGRILETGQKGETKLVFSPNSDRLITAGVPEDDSSSCVKVWESGSWNLLSKLGDYRKDPHSLAWSSVDDQNRIAVGFGHGEIVVYDGQSYQVEYQLEVGGTVNSLAFSPDGRKLAGTNERTSSVHVWEFSDNRPRLLPVIRGHSRVVSGVCFMANNSEIVSSSRDFSFRKWELDQSGAFETVSDVSGLWDSYFFPSGRMSAIRPIGQAFWHHSTDRSGGMSETGANDSIVAFSDRCESCVRIERNAETQEFHLKHWKSTEQGRSLRLESAIPLDPKIWPPENFVVSQDGSRIAISKGVRVATYDLLESESRITVGAEWTVKIPSNRVWLELAISPDGRLVAAKSWHYVVLHDVNANKSGELIKMSSDSGSASGRGLRFSPDGKYLAMAEWFNQVRMLEIESQEQFQFRGHTGNVGTIDFSPDGNLIVSGGTDDGTIRLWDVKSQELLLTLPAHQQGVRSVAFSKDGQTIASFGRLDEGIKLWRRATEPELHKSPQYLKIQAESHAEQENWELALSDWNKFVENSPVADFGIGYFQRARIYRNLKSWDKAAKEYVAYVESDRYARSSPGSYTHSDFVGNEEAFDALERYRPDALPRELRLARGRFLAHRSDWTGAIEAYRQTELEYKFHDYSLVEKVGLLSIAGDNDACRKLFDRLFREVGDSRSKQGLFQSVVISAITSSPKVQQEWVVKSAKRLLEAGKNHYWWEGLSHLQTGDPQKAIAILDNGISIGEKLGSTGELGIVYGHIIKSLALLDLDSTESLDNVRESIRLAKEAKKKYFDDGFQYLTVDWIMIHAFLQRAESELSTREANANQESSDNQ